MLHAAAHRELGLDDWSYQAIECDEEALPGLLNSLGSDWAGLSLTMPLKRAVLPLLDRADPLVIKVNAANTVVFQNGARLGYNTDVPGMVTALREGGISDVAVASPERILVLGAGATACSALAALRSMGSAGVWVAVRDQRTAGPLQQVAGELGMGVQLVPYARPVRPSGAWQLVISTVPAGAADRYAEQITAGTLAAEAVLDVVYYPWPTILARAAHQAGFKVISGFELLLNQAAVQVELMTGQPAPVEAMRTAGLAELARRGLSGL